jgi:hypothetical protein
MSESYFNFFGDDASNEYDTYNDNTFEFIEMYGIPVLYLPRTAVKQDELFGEDVMSTYSEVVPCKMYLEDQTIFGGGGDVFARFGLEVDDTLKLKIQQDYIKSLLGDVPEIADLIQFSFNKDLFEITHVEDEEIFYINGKQTTYTLSCKRFVYSGEIMETGETTIDILDPETTPIVDDGIQTFDDVLEFDETDPFGHGF